MPEVLEVNEKTIRRRHKEMILLLKVNEFLEFKELNSLIVHSLISRIEVGYRDNPRTIKIYYKFIDTTLKNIRTLFAYIRTHTTTFVKIKKIE